ncbi:hypothetical protein C1646_809326 [Rhizophagus diaphanus]|nr:hypothetical protein C1646_809326 [Rhizophagus diaphanus] [Rhizophagus sp. MUCL 43196]
MACSKIFLGDLPELLNEIIQYSHHDYKTLYSCILVNRLWCRLTIPLLWEDPFSIKCSKNYKFIEIYLYNLKDNNKEILDEYVTFNNLFHSHTLFNYPSFIKCLNIQNISSSVKRWVKNQPSNFIKDTFQMSDFIKLINRSLLLLFIENEVNLCSLEISIEYYQEHEYSDTLELIIQNPNFICNIKNLTLEFEEIADNMTKFLTFLYSNCNSISSLYFLFPDDYPTIEKGLPQFINSQENLKKILIGLNYFPLYHSLISLKNSNCSNTLNTITFYYIDFYNIIVLNEVFDQLNVLESIHFIYCYSLDSKFVQQIISITKPFKLKSLFLDEILHIESLELLMKKSGDYLENFGINIYRSQQLLQLFELAIKYCSKIKFLYLYIGLNDQIINLMFNLIENIKKNLNYLLIDCYGFDYNNHFSSTILQNLGQILPFKLESLNLSLAIINGSDLKVFLKNSQNTFIKKLVIRCKKKEKIEDFLPYIEEYIIKKKRVKYLAILGKGEDLFSLKDKVKEFKLYGIQVLYYSDLCINIDHFIKESYL